MIDDYNPDRLDYLGKYVTVPTGSYEICTYSHEGPVHGVVEVDCDEPVEGMLIGETLQYCNVVVRNDEGLHIVIIVPSNEL